MELLIEQEIGLNVLAVVIWQVNLFEIPQAFNTKKITGQDVIDFIEFRRLQAEGAAFDAEFMAAVLGKPQK